MFRCRATAAAMGPALSRLQNAATPSSVLPVLTARALHSNAPASSTVLSPASLRSFSSSSFQGPSAVPVGLRYQQALGQDGFRIFFVSPGGEPMSPWHDLPLRATGATADGQPLFHYVNEIARGTTAKMEIATKEKGNPIKQDVKKGALRHFKYGNLPFNYGALPQTYEDPGHKHPDTGYNGDNDPLDVVELSGLPLAMGGVYPVRVLGLMALIDEEETDWKILALAHSQDGPDPAKLLEEMVPVVRDWFKNYKVPDGKPVNSYAFDEQVKPAGYALKVIEECHQSWKTLVKSKREL